MIEKNVFNNPEGNRDDEVNIGKFIGSLVDNKWLIIGITTFFVVFGLIYNILATPVYRADALIQVEKNAGSSLGNDISSAFSMTQSDSTTEIELIKSRMIMDKTIKNLDLDTIIEEDSLPIIGPGIKRFLKKTTPKIAISRLTVPNTWLDKYIELKVIDNNSYIITIGDNIKIKGQSGVLLNENGFEMLVSEIKAPDNTIFKVKKKSELNAINDLLNEFTVMDRGNDTGVLQLTFDGPDPILTRKILDSICQNYLQQNVERKSEEAGKSLAFLQGQLPQIRASLDEAENKLNTYRQKNDSVDLTLETKALLDSSVSLQTQANELQFREAEVSQLYTKDHPVYKTLLGKRVTIEKEQKDLDARISAMPKTQQEILRLTRDVQSGQEVYMQLLNKQQELSINKASTIGNVRIIDTAETANNPVKPKKTLVIIVLAMLGFVFTVIYILIRDILHRGIQSAEQLEEAGINVYANIPLSEWQRKVDQRYSGRNKNKISEKKEILAIGNSADIAIEAIRSLRTSLHFAMMEAKNNILMISGASPSIGKTFISVNLSVIIAQAGKKVLLIDMDMRRGHIHELLSNVKGSEQKGLSEVLSNQCTVHEALNTTNIDGLDFIKRGPVPPNPSELLMNESMLRLLQWAQKNYEIVILDTPPILAVTDAAIVSRHVGTSFLVSRFDTTTLKEVQLSIYRFEQNGAEIKGVIINGVTKKSSGYHGYGDYAYYTYEYKSDKK